MLISESQIDLKMNCPLRFLIHFYCYLYSLLTVTKKQPAAFYQRQRATGTDQKIRTTDISEFNNMAETETFELGEVAYFKLNNLRMLVWKRLQDNWYSMRYIGPDGTIQTIDVRGPELSKVPLSDLNPIIQLKAFT